MMLLYYTLGVQGGKRSVLDEINDMKMNNYDKWMDTLAN